MVNQYRTLFIFEQKSKLNRIIMCMVHYHTVSVHRLIYIGTTICVAPGYICRGPLKL